MLNIYKSNQMENLMEALVSNLKNGPDDPMVPEWIGIQSRGMKQWITLQTAAHLGVCANINFVFPRQMIDYIIGCAQPEDVVTDSLIHSPVESLTREFLFWSVFNKIRGKDNSKEIEAVSAYIRDDNIGTKPYQFAMKAAAAFDDYQIYRPDMLLDWENGKSKIKDSAVLWQSMIWREIVLKGENNNLPNKALDFLNNFNADNFNKENLPRRMSLFGISSLPNIFIDIFERISSVIDINFFFLVPSDQYFFDLKSSRQLEKLALKTGEASDADDSHYETGNPLLSSMGESIKAFCSYIENFDYTEPVQGLYNDPLPDKHSGKQDSMLKVLQSDIFNLVHRKQKKDRIKLSQGIQDRDVQIHSCHSPMREAQVLKDILLDEFRKDPGLAPHDILIMMPDIESYAPFISSVFTVEPSLPFTISDRRRRTESELIEAFLKILALKSSRFEKRQVLDLLLSEAIAEKFNISLDQIPEIEKVVSAAKILWGKDRDHRQSMGLPPFRENTWETGLHRLFMGMAMPEHHGQPVQNVLPCESFEGSELELLGRFSGFCSMLFSCLDMLSPDKTIDSWVETFKKLISLLLARNNNNSEDYNFLYNTIDLIAEEAGDAGFYGKVSFEVISGILEHKLDLSISQGNFMAGRITFCNIMPMRSIPFKIVGLMGMDEKSFPRQSFRPGFDLIRKYPRPGDKNERDEDRYLFLEALLSAREKLLITYTGMSIQDNSLIPCSSIVSELIETISDSFVFSEKEEIVNYHPLHPFDRIYFNGRKFFKSFSSDHCNIAKAVFNKDNEPYKFIKNKPAANEKQDVAEMYLDDLTFFFRNPVKVYLQAGLNMKFPDIAEQPVDRETFDLSGLEKFALGSEMLRKGLKEDSADLYHAFKAGGYLPFGEKGRSEYYKIEKSTQPLVEAAKEIMNQKALPPIVQSMQFGNLLVSGHISGIRETGLCFINYGKLNSSRLINAWIHHLFYSIVKPETYPDTTHLVGQDPDGKVPVKKIVFRCPGSKAEGYLTELVDIFEKGHLRPFYFFCRTSLEFVKAMLKNKYDLNSQNILKVVNQPNVRDFWKGSRYINGENQDRYLSLCFRDNDPFCSIDTLKRTGFIENSFSVYKPLLENMEIVS